MTRVAAGGGLAHAIPDGAHVADLAGAQIIRVGEAAEALPAPVLPTHGDSLPALTQATPADVVSGWVRIWIAGFLADRAQWDGVICALHGDLSHWLHISADEIVSCQSFLTPRLIAVLGGSDMAAPEAVADSMSRPERLAAQLRVAEVEARQDALTGHLIGAELAGARAYWLGQQVGVIGEGALAEAYTAALAEQGCPVDQVRVADILPKGLCALQDRFQLGC